MYHSPGLRDGVSRQGTRVRPYHPTIFLAGLVIARIIPAGNKFGRSQVLRVEGECGQAMPKLILEKRSEDFSMVRFARPLGNWQNPLFEGTV